MAKNDLTKLTVSELKAMCKERKLSNYSKLKKAELTQALIDDGVEHEVSTKPSKSSSSETATKTSPAKPRVDKMSTRLEKIVQMEEYKDGLEKLDKDVSDDTLLEMFNTVFEEFFNDESLHTEADYKKYVTEYGHYEALNKFSSANDAVDVKALLEGPLKVFYEKLTLFIYKDDLEVKSKLITKARKYVDKIHKQIEKEQNKQKKEKAVKASSKKKVDNSESEPSESESDDESETDETPKKKDKSSKEASSKNKVVEDSESDDEPVESEPESEVDEKPKKKGKSSKKK